MHASLTDLARARARRDAQLMPMEATVLNPALAINGMLRVEVDTQPGRPRLCPWQRPVDDAGLPSEPSPGDAVLVVESDAGNLWAVVVWAQ